MNKNAVTFEEVLYKVLKDPAVALAYMEDAIAGDDLEFVALAFSDVVFAQTGRELSKEDDLQIVIDTLKERVRAMTDKNNGALLRALPN